MFFCLLPRLRVFQFGLFTNSVQGFFKRLEAHRKAVLVQGVQDGLSAYPGSQSPFYFREDIPKAAGFISPALGVGHVYQGIG
ncbi:hypothetical protein OX88_19560 [Pseudomonas coronafaciens pv. porri]|nr:hypothetical protein OX88_19560 [Pseudomonas coronafaciens pv. porri]